MPLRIEILFAFCIMEPTSAKRREEGIIIMEREHHPLIVHDGRKKRIVRPIAAKIYVPIALRRKEGEQARGMLSNAANCIGVKFGKDLLFEFAGLMPRRMRFVENFNAQHPIAS